MALRIVRLLCYQNGAGESVSGAGDFANPVTGTCRIEECAMFTEDVRKTCETVKRRMMEDRSIA